MTAEKNRMELPPIRGGYGRLRGEFGKRCEALEFLRENLT